MRNTILSIVIPVWNEAENITPLVERIHAALEVKNVSYEIIFIDDHSQDNTTTTIKKLAQKYPIKLFVKKGVRGKAQSLYEGFDQAQGKILVMLDGDLQYPPEAIPEMMKKIEKGADIVVANRVKTHTSRLRKFLSSGFKKFFGEVLFGLQTDVQAGMKMFRRDVYTFLQFHPTSGWTFDLEFLHKATQAGFLVENVDIIFEKRAHGKSKVSFVKTSWEIGLNALSVKTRRSDPMHFPPKEKKSMKGAGVGFNRRKYVTHSTLHHSHSAIQTFIRKQKWIGLGLVTVTVIAFVIRPLLTAQIVIGVLSFIYFLDVIFNLFLVLKSLHFPQEIISTDEELAKISDNKLPIYSILCPLYKEAHVIEQFVTAISTLDYPKEKLDVMLLLEEDDKATIQTARAMQLPEYVSIVVVPDSQPKTKPKACNYGLSQAKGEYLVIYDAEDMPEKLQLKKAFLAFQKVDKNVLCLQAKLNYYNPHQNLLTRFFTAEYSLWFDVTLTGLQAANTSIPLGGTSNHFRTKDLRNLEGWDPFNVTEDADLGIRLFKKGYTTAIIDSVTLEEANSNVRNWIRQRSRWIKGYMQTYLVHTRKRFGYHTNFLHTLLFHLNIGGKIAFILINPILWVLTISYFALYAIVGPTIEALYPSYIFYMAAFSLVAGNFLFLYYYMIGCAKREQWGLIKYIYLVPFYWLLISWAGFVAFYQLLFKPHYWEKTIHGLHLNKKQKRIIAEAIVQEEEKVGFIPFPQNFKVQLRYLIDKSKAYIGGMFLISASIIANFLNFGFNAYLGRVLKLEDFALVSLVAGFLSFTSILTGAYSTTSNYRSAFLMGKHGDESGFSYWKQARKYSLIIGLVIAVFWVALTPVIMKGFDYKSPYVFLTFSIVLLVGLATGADRGFISAKLMFGSLAIINFVEPVVKLVTAVVLVKIHHGFWTYISIPLSILTTFTLGYFLIIRQVKSGKVEHIQKEIKHFPVKFFSASLFTSFSSIVFMSMDVVLANHYLSSRDAGKYALLSLVGKMVYFLGGLTTPFIVPLISRSEGAKRDSSKTLNILLMSTASLALIGFISFGIFGYFSIPLLYGHKSVQIVPYLAAFTFGMMCFTVSKVFINYYLVKKIYTFTAIASLIGIVQFMLIILYHNTVQSFALDMAFVWTLHLFLMTLLHIFATQVKTFENNVNDFIGLFTKIKSNNNKNSLNILIFNWRDVKHKWAGGAEVYIHELAKEWVKGGNNVTIFSGNDGRHSRNEVLDSIQIIRRGGFYTVYIWAFLYYIFRFRNRYDVIIDSENGIPFFTPLYINKPIYLLIHHVHQEVFREHLRFPLSWIAQKIECNLMPLVYKNRSIVTVSDSSKKEVIKFGLAQEKNITVINPGIILNDYKQLEKTKHPSILYLGRLKPYKNVDVAIKAFEKIQKEIPNVKFTIAGTGESFGSLTKLTKSLGLEDHIIFEGAVSDERKKQLLSESWVMIQPSMIEGWGITVIEANASGTPVIASNVNGLRDSIVDNITGILVPAKDTLKFTEALLHVLQSKQLRSNLSKKAYSWSKSFSWELSANKFIYVLIPTDISITTEAKIATV